MCVGSKDTKCLIVKGRSSMTHKCHIKMVGVGDGGGIFRSNEMGLEVSR